MGDLTCLLPFFFPTKCSTDQAQYFRLINNAGIAIESKNPNPIHLLDESDWDLTMHVNARSVFLGCKYAIAQMLQQQPNSSGDRGWIVNISSVFGLMGGPTSRKYNITLYEELYKASDRLISWIFPSSFVLCEQGGHR